MFSLCLKLNSKPTLLLFSFSLFGTLQRILNYFPCVLSEKATCWEMMKENLTCIKTSSAYFIFSLTALCNNLYLLAFGSKFDTLHFDIKLQIGFSFQLGLNCAVCLRFLNLCSLALCIFSQLCIHDQIKFFPLCEPGEIPWFAERVNWSQSMALSDEFLLSVFNY